ncbi:MAG: MBL fold metallo-hydrolase [Chloroflexi bacterium]|nr:MBL fold metallo-hydrolase [Chloroflexota bacterium]
MEITWLGHSSLKLLTQGATLITDPYADSVGFAMGRHWADIVTISNDHPHHSHRAAMEGTPRFIVGPGEYEIADFYITGMGTRLSAEEGERRTNTVFTFQVEGLTLCHLGDLGGMPSPGQVRQLNQADVLFVPAGGACTIGAGRLAELVNMIEPRIVVPLHYRTDGIAVELGSLDEFLAELGVAESEPQAKLTVTSTSLPRDLGLVVLKRGT